MLHNSKSTNSSTLIILSVLVFFLSTNISEAQGKEKKFKTVRMKFSSLKENMFIPVKPAVKKLGTEIILPGKDGLRYKIERKGNIVLIDTNADGKVDKKIARNNLTLTFVLLYDKKKKNYYQLRFFYKLKKGTKKVDWYYTHASCMRCRIMATPIYLIDCNLNGKFNEIGIDGIVVGKTLHARILDTEIGVKNKLYEIKVNSSGTELKYREVEIPSDLKKYIYALNRLNELRAEAGLKPVGLDWDNSRACEAHAKYLILNAGRPEVKGLKAHKEQPNLPGYSKKGALAGQRGVISFGHRRLVDAIDGWVGTFFHRIPLFHPQLKKVGLGFCKHIVVMDCKTGIDTSLELGIARPARKFGKDDFRRSEDNFTCILYPAPEQRDIPTVFNNELPDPYPPRARKPGGFAVSVMFFGNTNISDVKIKLINRYGREVECYLNKPGSPFNKSFPQKNVIGLIPKKPLSRNLKYTVKFECKISGKVIKEKWSFYTGKRSKW